MNHRENADAESSTASGEATPDVSFNPVTRRYEISLDGEVAGYASYTTVDGVRVFDHTVVDPAFQGRGLAGVLVDRAIADVTAQGGRFAATCSYVVRWLDRHHDYDAALVDPPRWR